MKPKPLIEQIHIISLDWRAGATNLRDEYRNAVTRAVPFEVEAAAMTMEQCASRLEQVAATAALPPVAEPKEPQNPK